MINPDYYNQSFDNDDEINMILYDCVLNSNYDSLISLLCERSDIFKNIGYTKDIINLLKYNN